MEVEIGDSIGIIIRESSRSGKLITSHVKLQLQTDVEGYNIY